MSDLLDYFQAIFIINLPTRQDRRNEIEEQLKKIGLSLKHPKIHLFPAIRPEDKGDFPSIGSRGCFLSHLSVLKEVKQLKIDNVLIFEDDLDFSSDFKKLIDKPIVTLHNSNWGIFYGGYRSNQELGSAKNGLITIDSDKNLFCTHFVGFRQPTIDQLIIYLEKMLARPAGSPDGGPMHVDGAYSWFRKQNPDVITLCAVPQLGYQRKSRTDIHELAWYDRWIGLKHVAQLLRRALKT